MTDGESSNNDARIGKKLPGLSRAERNGCWHDPLVSWEPASLGIVVIEIISNIHSCIHAFPGRTGAIHVTLVRSAAGAILTICDDGSALCSLPRASATALGWRGAS